MGELLKELRGMASDTALKDNRRLGAKLREEFAGSGVRFAATPSRLADVHRAAAERLADCLDADGRGRPVLQEGGVYKGCWLESTGTINAELLSRFCPSVAEATFEQFADLQREDGLIPYKVTSAAPVFKQIQLVTPPARSVWNHYRLNGGPEGAGLEWLRKMYESLSRYDDWLAANRDTRGTGAVEAFCAFDTGHDLSPRFWHVPDAPYKGDPARFDPNSPVLPFVAPDLTASVYCGRLYLARMAEELGDKDAAEKWSLKAEKSLQSLIRNCFDEKDGFFYDADAGGRFVRIQSDVLLRVLASEVGDGAFFVSSLSRYLLNTRKFFAKYPLTSIAMDDPRFDPSSSYNSWAGPVNFLSLIRAPHAFERHGRHVELTWILQPILSALSRMERFGQTLSPWTGEEGYTEAYSPAILCALDFVERICGIQPTPEGELRFTGLLPSAVDHGSPVAEETAYSRTVDGVVYELYNTAEECYVFADGQLRFRFPAGVRLVTDRNGKLQSVVGMSARKVEGALLADGREIPLRVKGNEVWRAENGRLTLESAIGVVLPTYE
ncbi:MGH1-like glycoside hydrolase domain-containing protein [Cohnella thailandensis]|uniref:Mannosylglycerate hydrolase MGH1-like glycoside hydrolase domain-containing protein n=1 Tax=Cohnella thailandensis TaxID=557557 RepID=A0A841SSR8_9BACL|nr:hypothetical protein [Cohnella thailandensis]MBB6634984.1 hypothetical protein [Cohnella thailandensis]MBP1975793.1 hypothetical protein [Cohnella thailandensis]